MDDKLVLKNRLKEGQKPAKALSEPAGGDGGRFLNTISSIETRQFNPTAKLALILCTPWTGSLGAVFFDE